MGQKRKIPVGIYEKAFPGDYSLERILISAKEIGYDFVELAVDESPERLQRLDWTKSERSALRRAISDTGIPFWGMGISAHRKYPLGSLSPEVRQQGMDIFYRSIDLAVDLGLRVLQVMGYDAFYEPSTAETQAYYMEGLRAGVEWASACGVMLALENIDHEFVDSVEKAMRIVKELDSPWFNVYPDLGNMTAFGYDPIKQLPLAAGFMVGLHVKDTRPGEVRGIPLEQGNVPFQEAFHLLAKMGYRGPMVMEMWAHLDPTGDPIGSAAQALAKLERWIDSAWE